MFVQTIEYEVEIDEDGYYECPECKEQVNIESIDKHVCMRNDIDWDKGEWSLI